MREVWQALSEVMTRGESAALATVVRTTGSTPQQPGARLLLRADDSQIGTIGGGAIEQLVVEALRQALASGQSQLLVKDLARDLGMCCGGRMEIFVEALRAAPRLWLFGAGHVAQPTAALARSVGFEVSVVDEREEWNTPERFPNCTLVQRDPAEHMARTTFGDGDWVLIATHDHQLDEAVLGRCLSQKPRYIGLVGSRRKVFRLIERIAAKIPGNIGPLERVYAPVGLDLGAVGPQEIAVSIVSELIALKHGRDVPHLRAVDDPRLGRALEEQHGE